MEDILDMIEGFVEMIESLIDFVMDLVQGLLYIYDLLFTIIGNLPSYLAWMPGSFSYLIIAIFGIVVIYKVLGREG